MTTLDPDTLWRVVFSAMDALTDQGQQPGNRLAFLTLLPDPGLGRKRAHVVRLTLEIAEAWGPPVHESLCGRSFDTLVGTTERDGGRGANCKNCLRSIRTREQPWWVNWSPNRDPELAELEGPIEEDEVEDLEPMSGRRTCHDCERTHEFGPDEYNEGRGPTTCPRCGSPHCSITWDE